MIQELNIIKTKDKKIVSSMRCAGYLMLHGCRLVRMEQHKEIENRNIFIFYDDQKTNYYLHKYTVEVSKHNEPKDIYIGSDRTRVQGMA